MASVSVRLPSLLTSLLRIPKSIDVSGPTLEAVLIDLKQRCPSLAVHLFDESGSLREHVLLFINETNSRDVDASNYRLKNGDVITVLQAVSGG